MCKGESKCGVASAPSLAWFPLMSLLVLALSCSPDSSLESPAEALVPLHLLCFLSSNLTSQTVCPLLLQALPSCSLTSSPCAVTACGVFVLSLLEPQGSCGPGTPSHTSQAAGHGFSSSSSLRRAEYSSVSVSYCLRRKWYLGKFCRIHYCEICLGMKLRYWEK